MASPNTKAVKGNRQIQAFFDEIAAKYREAHGHSEQLLLYRMSLIERLVGQQRGTILEIGCGTGSHLLHFACEFVQAIGTDLAPKMIEVAKLNRDRHPCKKKISLFTDPAEQLGHIDNEQIDIVFCVGALEHMPEKQAVFAQIKRVLKPAGEFICLTPNGGYCWYRQIAPRLKLPVKHLSSDEFLTRESASEALQQAGLRMQKSGCWTFIPKGDMPTMLYWPLVCLDQLGRWLRIPSFRGGIYFKAVKPSAPEDPIDE